MVNVVLIKVFENDYDYTYEQYFLVEKDIEKINAILEVIENAKSLDSIEREEKYGTQSIIELVEDYIVKNLKKIDYTRVDIDCY